MTVANRNTLQRSRRAEDFHIEALGANVRLKQISAADQIHIMSRAKEIEQSKEYERARQYQLWNADLIRRTLVDEDGEPMYSKDETSAIINELSPEAMNEITEKAAQFLGLANNDDEPQAKKSSGTRNGGSNSGSA